jgi:pilus assembly protein CpaB
MKPARLIVLAIALAAGGVAALLASGSRQPEPPKAPPAPSLATVDVLVAKSDLAVGQLVSQKDIAWQSWPASSAGNFIKKTDRPDAIKDFEGAIVRAPVATGEPIRDFKVVMAKGGFLAAVLPRGMRAVSVEISPQNGAGGFILPDDHVDVVLTRADKTAEKTGGDKFISETILRNVRVLAVDQTIEEKNGQKVAVGKTATLEVTPEQAETIALARQVGTISLALRSLLDSQSSIPESNERDEKRSAINTVRYGVTTQTTPR